MADREDPSRVTDADLPPNYREPGTGGTLAGEDVDGGSVLRHEGWNTVEPLTVPDSIGEEVEVAPEFAGTVAGNTTGAEVLLAREYQDREPADETEDLGPEGTIIQEVGGEARY